MSDRRVEQIYPTPAAKSEGHLMFSQVLDTPNVVLLGEPGLGKSHLFSEFSTFEHASLHTARSFRIAAKNIAIGDSLYIDALDEKRPRGTNANTIEEMILQISELEPRSLRISCRSADWLGETDLEMFRPYFDAHGGYKVIKLLPLEDEDIDRILIAEGVSDPEGFRRNAQVKGVSELLVNPQNLLLLIDIARKGNWPESRFELFEFATNELLKEAKTIHQLPNSSLNTSNLAEPAGACCLAMLIADVAGVSLLGQDIEDCPSYTEIPFESKEQLFTALQRKVFEHFDTNLVRPSHRTIAEFLGAKWINEQLSSGYSINRFLAAISVNGYPASELRGVFAWLATLSSIFADRLIPLDPYGVLMYGDPQKLVPAQRQLLLSSLTKLSEEDPWFRADDWETERLGALSSVEMVEPFREVLNNNTSYHLKTLVIDSIIEGPPLEALSPALIELFQDSEVETNLRFEAFRALTHCSGVVPQSELSYLARSEDSDCSHSLKLKIMLEYYSSGNFTPIQVANLLVDIYYGVVKESIGAIWRAPRTLPVQDQALVLDHISSSKRFDAKRSDRPKNSFDFQHCFSRMIARCLDDDRASQLAVPRVWRWLSTLQMCHPSPDESLAKSLKTWLSLEEDKTSSVFLLGFKEAEASKRFNVWSAYNHFSKNILNQFDQTQLLLKVFDQIKVESSASKTNLFEFLVEACLHQKFSETALFESVYDYGVKEGYKPVLDNLCHCKIEEWRLDRNKMSREQAEEYAANILKSQENFRANIEPIRQGIHLGWLNHCSKIYFAVYSDISSDLPREKRLEQIFGEQLSVIAQEGLSNYLLASDIPSVSEVAKIYGQGKTTDLWYTVLASAEELFQQHQKLTNLPIEKIRSVLAVSYIHKIPEHDESYVSGIDFGWQKELADSYPDLNQAVLLSLVEARFANRKEARPELKKLSELSAANTPSVLFKLLEKYPAPEVSSLRDLVLVNFPNDSEQKELFQFSKNILRAKNKVKGEKRALYVVVVFLLENKALEASLLRYAARSPQFIWAFIRFYGELKVQREGFQLPVSKLIILINLFGKAYPDAGHPLGAWYGDKNPWDASDFVKKMAAALSAEVSVEARSGLEELCSQKKLSSYQEYFKHLRSNQRKKYLQSLYVQPTWQETIEALAGQSTSNVADLHAVSMDILSSVSYEIKGANTDQFKKFWNEKNGKVTNPKVENSSNKVMVDFLRPHFLKLGISVDPEGHMRNDKRADIVIQRQSIKIPIEAKRHYHKALWTAWRDQLDKLYSGDYYSKGYGIYLVYWFGTQFALPKHPQGQSLPTSALELESAINGLIPVDDRHRLKCHVVDVTGA